MCSSPAPVGGRGAEVAARALAAHAQPGAVPVPFLFGGPAHDVVDLLGRSGKAMARCQHVVGVHHHDTCVRGQVPAPWVVLFGVPDDEPAAVDVDIHRRTPHVRRWVVERCGDGAVPSGDGGLRAAAGISAKRTAAFGAGLTAPANTRAKVSAATGKDKIDMDGSIGL